MTEVNQIHLRRPFTAAAVRFRPQAKTPNANGNVRCLTYIDARLVAERLTEVAPDWSETPVEWLAATSDDPLGRAMNYPCRVGITINGITRYGVGQLDSTAIDDKYAKSAESDAFKRAGVKWGIGSYLYTLGDAWVNRNGVWMKGDRVGGLNDEGMRQLRSWYDRIISSPAFVARFGAPIDYGDAIVADLHGETRPIPEELSDVEAQGPELEQQQDDPDASARDEALIAAAGELAASANGNRNATTRWMKSLKDKDRGLTKAIAKAKENGVHRPVVEAVLSENGLQHFIEAFDATVISTTTTQ